MCRARSILMFIFGRLHVYMEQQPEKYISYFSKSSCFFKGAQRDRVGALTEPALACIAMHGYHSDISRPLLNEADPHWGREIWFLHPSPQTGFFFKNSRFLKTWELFFWRTFLTPSEGYESLTCMWQPRVPWRRGALGRLKYLQFIICFLWTRRRACGWQKKTQD